MSRVSEMTRRVFLNDKITRLTNSGVKITPQILRELEEQVDIAMEDRDYFASEPDPDFYDRDRES